jgi:hypothetical protein
LVVRCAEKPTAKEFDEHLSEAIAMESTTRVVLVALVGDGADHHFDSEQRAKLFKAGMFTKPHALMAPPVRPEIILSMRWLGATIRTFGPDSLEEVCDHLEIDESLREKLASVIAASKRLIEEEPSEKAAMAPFRRA